MENQQEPNEAPQGNETSRASRIFLIVLIVICILLAGLLTILIVDFRSNRASLKEAAFEDAKAQAAVAAQQLSEDFAGAMARLDDVAEDLSSGDLAYDDIEIYLQEYLAELPNSEGLVVAFAPFIYDSSVRLHYISVYRDADENLVVENGEPSFDYTLPTGGDNAGSQALYFNRVNDGASISEPFWDEEESQVLIQYGTPFFYTDPETGEKVVAGVVAEDFSLEKMRHLVAKLDLGQTGYGAVFSQNGTWLSHPVAEFTAVYNIQDSIQGLENQEIAEAVNLALDGEMVSLSRREPATGVDVWTVFNPIESTKWVLIAELPQSEFLPDSKITLQDITVIFLVAAALLFFILVVVLRLDRPRPRRLWVASLAFSAIVLAVIVALIVMSRQVDQGDGLMISSQTSLNSFLENLQDSYEERGLVPPIEIPTGVLIQSARFPDSGSTVVNGYIWQRVPKIEGQDVLEGFTLPQTIDEPFQIEEITREERRDETYILWSFLATLRQIFDPLEYPFDRYNINIRLAPKEMLNNAVLIPDLGSYVSTIPAILPGLESGVRINDWQIVSSSFSFGFGEYNTNLGIPGKPTILVPELSLNINAQRRFLGPFIAFLMPAFVAALMVFAFLLYDQKPDEPEEIVTALSYTAALFFVIAVVHTALRDDAAAIGLTYLEYFYLLLYVMIIAVGVNTFVVVRQSKNKVFRYGNNLVIKVLFWPVTVLVMLVATLTIFVYG